MIQDSNPNRGKSLSLLCNIQTSTWSHPDSYSVCTAYTLPGVKQPGHGAHYLSTANARVRNEGIHSLCPSVCLNGMYWDNFTYPLWLVGVRLEIKWLEELDKEEVPEEILATLQLRILCLHESEWYNVYNYNFIICFVLADDREQLWAPSHTVLNINVPYNAGNFSADWGPVTFVRRSLLHGSHLFFYEISCLKQQKSLDKRYFIFAVRTVLTWVW